MANLVPFGNGFMLDHFFDEFFRPASLSRANFNGFRLDVRDEGDRYEIEADLPGVKKEEVSLSLCDGTLEISVQHEDKTENMDEAGRYLHRERRIASCKRSIYLGDADASGITARLDCGVLQIAVPKLSQTSNSHTIPIQ